MASYYHHHHHHPTSATTPCYCCCSHPHLHHTPPPPPPPHFPYHFQEQQREQQLQPIIASLLRRISALESFLKRYSASASSSLRDAAARTIQTHFRAFILRRSTNLRHLKHLASIKSQLNALKSSLSTNHNIHYHLLHAKATNLLLQLHTIQGGDPMIRDGKLSIRRDLNRFFKLIDGVYLKKSELSSRIVKNVRCGGNTSKPRAVYSDQRRAKNDTVELGRYGDATRKVRELSRRIGELDVVDESEGDEYEDLDNFRTLLGRKKGVSVSRTGGIESHDASQANMKRGVHFADNEKAYGVIRRRNEPFLIGECDSADDSDLEDTDQLLIIDDHCRETQENGNFSQEKGEDEDEAQTEDDEGSPPSSNGGSDVTFSSRSRNEAGRTSYDQSEDGSFTFCAPLPVKMEPRAHLISRTKLIK